MVETRADWFCEAVWDRDFEAGDFDRTDIVFGSGGRVRATNMIFVSAGSTVDRLLSIERSGEIWVSNSLPCLLWSVGAEVDPFYSGYVYDFRSIVKGLERYEKWLKTSAGTVRLTYFNNLRWDGRRLIEMPKPGAVRDFGTYASYRHFLETSITALAENMSSTARMHPYRMLGTLSRGYDSPTVAVLAKKCGLREVFSFDEARGGVEDSGKRIADVLGLELTAVSRESWRSGSYPEVPFLASDANGGDVNFKAAERLLPGRVLMTGFHGDRVWEKGAAVPSDAIERGDQSGLSLSEYRLWVGFIHCPVPFMGVRQLRDIVSISRSPEMAAWDVGGDYTRPICRRVVEDAGVTRSMFGSVKNYGSVRLSARGIFLSPVSAQDYATWLKALRHLCWRNGRIPPQFLTRLFYPWQRLCGAAVKALRSASDSAPDRSKIVRRLEYFADREYLYLFLFPWAIARAAQRYQVNGVHELLRRPAGQKETH